MIEHDNYREIFRATGLSPSEWLRLQKEDNYRRNIKWRFHEVEARLYACRCRSVWCESCSRSSPTNNAITTILEGLDWRRVRHVILTVDRAYAPQEAFEEIRACRAIARTLKRLNPGLWSYLWALEWHADGYPHWHVLVQVDEAGAAGKIGKKRIQEAWGWGHVWEAYIRSEDHWRAICGYHQAKGYLAGERKAHQLELPEWLKSECRVRKFGSNVPRGTTRPEMPSRPGKPRKKSTPYKDRRCNQTSTIVVRGGAATLATPAVEARRILGEHLDRIDPTTFRGSLESLWDAILRIPQGDPDRDTPELPPRKNLGPLHHGGSEEPRRESPPPEEGTTPQRRRGVPAPKR